MARWGATGEVLSRTRSIDLTTQQVDRASRFLRPDAAGDYVAAHKLLRLCLRLAGIPADVEVFQCCARCGEGHGRPMLRDHPWSVSLSHTRGWVAAAVSESAVGVDIEEIARVKPEAIAPVLQPVEGAWIGAQPDPGLAGTRVWCRKEAVVKGCGRGLSAMRDVVVVGPSGLSTHWSDFAISERRLQRHVVTVAGRSASRGRDLAELRR